MWTASALISPRCWVAEKAGFRELPPSSDAVSEDPVLNRVKLIAEPWDLGTYEVGNFPVDWSEWNGRFRDTVRKFGKGDGGQNRRSGKSPDRLL